MKEIEMRKNYNILALIFFYLSVLAISGCGSSGGGGGGGGGATQQTLVPLATSVIRTYSQGDTLTATLKFTETSTGTVVTGDITITVGGIVQNPFGIDCKSGVFSGTLTGPGGTVAYLVRTLIYQDVDGSVYGCGEFNDDLNRYVFLTDTTESPNGIFLETKSPMQLGDSTSAVVFFDDGSWEDCTRTVQAKENVSVPLGLYETYKVAEACSYSDGTTLVNTIWTVPDIFNIKEIAQIDGFAVELLAISATLN